MDSLNHLHLGRLGRVCAFDRSGVYHHCPLLPGPQWKIVRGRLPVTRQQQDKPESDGHPVLRHGVSSLSRTTLLSSIAMATPRRTRALAVRRRTAPPQPPQRMDSGLGASRHPPFGTSTEAFLPRMRLTAGESGRGPMPGFRALPAIDSDRPQVYHGSDGSADRRGTN